MALESSNLSAFEKSKIIAQALLEAVKVVIVVPICAFFLATVFVFIIAITHAFELGEYGAWLGIIFALYAAYADIVIGPVVWWRVSAKRLGVSRKTNTIGTTAVSLFFAVVLFSVVWGEQAITNAPHLEDVSDDGRYVLATGPDSSSLYKIDTTSRIATLLPTTWQRRAGSYAALSPDSSQIAFAHSDDEKNYTIMLMDINGKSSHPLLNQGGNDSWPRFSRDGRTIYFIRTAGNGFDLFSSTLDGKNVTQLTHQHYTFKLGPYLQAAPAVSSDGKQLLLFAAGDEALQLCSLASANQKPSNLVFQLPNAPRSRIYVSAFFSPDDKGILFMAASEGKGGYAHDAYRLDLASRDVQKLTENNGYASDFRVSVSGTKAAFLKWKLSRFQKLPRSFQLQLMDIPSGRVTPVNFKGLPE